MRFHDMNNFIFYGDFMKKAFTLAEVMIVLTVIGVLTAILLPVARQSMPDKDLMKFKKAHNTLGTVIRELVTSDKYYKDGDLGVKPDGSLVDDLKYFCKTFADILNTNVVNCSEASVPSNEGSMQRLIPRFDGDFAITINDLDYYCKNSAPTIGGEIKTSDGTVFYQTNPDYSFGRTKDVDGDEIGRIFCMPFSDLSICHRITNDGYPHYTKGFCIDIDGIPSNATVDDCVNECPFGYSIRADGKIIAGARAQEWLARDINEE